VMIAVRTSPVRRIVIFATYRANAAGHRQDRRVIVFLVTLKQT
jgi:hypothetical protein